MVLAIGILTGMSFSFLGILFYLNRDRHLGE